MIEILILAIVFARGFMHPNKAITELQRESQLERDGNHIR